MPLSTHLEEAVALRRRALLHPNGDHFTLINIFNAFQQRECGLGLEVGGLRPCGHPTDPCVDLL